VYERRATELLDGARVHDAGEPVVRDVQRTHLTERRQVGGEPPLHRVGGQVEPLHPRQTPQTPWHGPDPVRRHVERDEPRKRFHAVDAREPVAGHVERLETRVGLLHPERAAELVAGDVDRAERRRAPEPARDGALQRVAREVERGERGQVRQRRPGHRAREVPRREAELSDRLACRLGSRGAEVAHVPERGGDDGRVVAAGARGGDGTGGKRGGQEEEQEEEEEGLDVEGHRRSKSCTSVSEEIPAGVALKELNAHRGSWRTTDGTQQGVEMRWFKTSR